MTGLIGRSAGDTEPEEMADAMVREDWYELESASEGAAAVGVLEHGTRDPDANVVWRGDGILGVVYGVVSNRDRLALSWGDLFRGIADDSRETLARLDGPFALACVDTRAGAVHLATDKAGSRPLYYAPVGDTGGADGPGEVDGVAFASELGPLVAERADPTLDPRAVGDLLLFGGVVGERTVLEGVGSLPPATRLTVDDGLSTERYWEPAAEGLAPSGYPDRWLADYRRALADVATTARDRTLWFPGDADSRIAAAVLADQSSPIRTLACASHSGGDRETAARVATNFETPNAGIHGDPGRHLVDAVADAVAATDAMVAWSAVDALPYVTDGLHEDADVLVHGDAALDAATWAGAIGADDSAASALYEHESVLPADTVRDLLAADADPLDAVDAVVANSVDGPAERTAVDAAAQVRAATELRTRAVQRGQVGTRTLASGSLLDTAARMPAAHRVGTRPISAPVGAGTPPIRRAVAERLGSDLAVIPTGPGGADSTASRREASGDEPGATAGDAYARRYATDDRFRRFVDDLLDGVAERAPLDADAVSALHERLAARELSTFAPVAALTGLELWARRHLDDDTAARGRSAVEVR
ncbi:Gln-dependent amino transferase [Halosimplex carlsbadense 2-9-1]|uniref:Gln-dependent amino transferase n=1 Tax=Halosimplex carlsbadense 2-9-1 TaxID=797114 RepID=M0CI53_9EURY|nr:Gln-dependent amino transferase [Halosimplex carlsbadense]ELZ22323.1 Gln-dependent amino transferase [Halosimplex carlsbadense 2-9-1]